MRTHDYNKHAKEYAELGLEGTDYLSFRDIPKLVEDYVKGENALDYGCGPGRSSRFLKKLGFNVVGVDISEAMLSQAKLKDKPGDYRLIQTGKLPFPDGSFDLVFSSYVFLEVASLAEIENILKEFRRVLRVGAHCIFTTSSELGYKGDWVSLSYDFPENNRELKSGETVRLLLRGTGVELYDYYWTHGDFQNTILRANLKLKKLHQPLGLQSDLINWRDEWKTPPVSVYLLEK